VFCQLLDAYFKDAIPMGKVICSSPAAQQRSRQQESGALPASRHHAAHVSTLCHHWEQQERSPSYIWWFCSYNWLHMSWLQHGACKGHISVVCQALRLTKPELSCR
jgi:hypothetical protein